MFDGGEAIIEESMNSPIKMLNNNNFTSGHSEGRVLGGWNPY